MILDTTVLIAAERDSFKMPAYLDPLGDAPVARAGIPASELLLGVERARNAADLAAFVRR